MSRIIAASLSAALCLTLPAAAENYNFSSKKPQALADDADLVVTGTIRQVEIARGVRYDGIDGMFRADIAVDNVVKGLTDCSQPVTANYYARLRSFPTDGFNCGPDSYYPLPEDGDVVRAYLELTPDGTYAVVPPNGFEILKPHRGDRLDDGGWLAAATPLFESDMPWGREILASFTTAACGIAVLFWRTGRRLAPS